MPYIFCPKNSAGGKFLQKVAKFTWLIMNPYHEGDM